MEDNHDNNRRDVATEDQPPLKRQRTDAEDKDVVIATIKEKDESSSSSSSEEEDEEEEEEEDEEEDPPLTDLLHATDLDRDDPPYPLDVLKRMRDTLNTATHRCDQAPMDPGDDDTAWWIMLRLDQDNHFRRQHDKERTTNAAFIAAYLRATYFRHPDEHT